MSLSAGKAIGHSALRVNGPGPLVGVLLPRADPLIAATHTPITTFYDSTLTEGRRQMRP